MIQNVEELRAELQPKAFRKLNVLHQYDISIGVVRTVKLIPSGVTFRSKGSLRKHIRLIGWSASSRARSDTVFLNSRASARIRITYNIGPRRRSCSVSGAGRIDAGYKDRVRMPSLRGNDARKLNSAQSFFSDAALQIPPSLSKGKLVQEINRCTLTQVIV